MNKSSHSRVSNGGSHSRPLLVIRTGGNIDAQTLVIGGDVKRIGFGIESRYTASKG